MERKVGDNFDEKKADEIFDALKNLKDNKISDNLKKEINITKNVSQLLEDVKTTDDNTAIYIYKEILTIDPTNYDAYVGLSEIYQKKNDVENEKKILKSAIQNLSGNKKAKLVERLKEINL